jgi:hypothetical protein
MKRNLKALGLACVAALAISAVAAAGARAQNPAADFTCGEEGEGACTITAEVHPGESTLLFKTSIGSISCDELHGTATAPHGEPFSELTVTNGEVGGCDFAGLAASVDFGDCHLTLHDGETIEEGVATSEVDISETEGKECSITIEAFGCTVTVGPEGNEGLSSVTLEDREGEITGEATVGGITYSYSGFTCGSGEKSDGVYHGNFTARAFTGETPTNLAIHDTPL